jgi:hypothetical protein
MARSWCGIVASMKARSKGAPAARSCCTSAAMSIVVDVPSCPAIPAPVVPGTMGILLIGGVWSEPYQDLRHTFNWSISALCPPMMFSASCLTSACSPRCWAILAISTAPRWWGTIIWMNCWSKGAALPPVPGMPLEPPGPQAATASPPDAARPPWDRR